MVQEQSSNCNLVNQNVILLQSIKKMEIVFKLIQINYTLKTNFKISHHTSTSRYIHFIIEFTIIIIITFYNVQSLSYSTVHVQYHCIKRNMILAIYWYMYIILRSY